MLDEAEWAEVSPYLNSYISAIKAYREEHQVGLAEARERISDMACAVYERLTGVHETNPNAIYHHRLSLYGPPCPSCGRLLRTPRASFCASCGWRPHPSSAL
jgi:hypothetical protein